MYNDGVRICVAWVTRVFSWIRAGRSLHKQITSGYFALFRDHAHPSSGRVVVYLLKLSRRLIGEDHGYLDGCMHSMPYRNTIRYFNTAASSCWLLNTECAFSAMILICLRTFPCWLGLWTFWRVVFWRVVIFVCQ